MKYKTILVSRKRLKIIEFGEGPKGGHFKINEHGKKTYCVGKNCLNDSDINNILKEFNNTPSKEIAKRTEVALAKFNSSSKNVKNAICAMGGKLLDKISGNQKVLDKLKDVGKSLSKKTKDEIIKSGIGQNVLKEAVNKIKYLGTLKGILNAALVGFQAVCFLFGVDSIDEEDIKKILNEDDDKDLEDEEDDEILDLDEDDYKYLDENEE